MLKLITSTAVISLQVGLSNAQNVQISQDQSIEGAIGVQFKAKPHMFYNLQTSDNLEEWNDASFSRMGVNDSLIGQQVEMTSDRLFFRIIESRIPHAAIQTMPGDPAVLKIEAENSGVLGENFRTIENGTASNGSYVGSPDNGEAVWSAGAADTMEFNFCVTEPGFYRLKAHSIGNGFGSDSFYVRLSPHNNGNWDKWDIPASNSFQDSYLRNPSNEDEDSVFFLNNFCQRVLVAIREDGAGLDFLELELVEPWEGVSIQAEDAIYVGEFDMRLNRLAEGGVYVATAENDFSQGAFQDDHVEFQFHVEKEGVYELQARAVPNGFGSDSFWVSFNDETQTSLWDLAPAERDFHEYIVSDMVGANMRKPIHKHLSLGENSVFIHMREAGTGIDRLSLVFIEEVK